MAGPSFAYAFVARLALGALVVSATSSSAAGEEGTSPFPSTCRRDATPRCVWWTPILAHLSTKPIRDLGRLEAYDLLVSVPRYSSKNHCGQMAAPSSVFARRLDLRAPIDTRPYFRALRQTTILGRKLSHVTRSETVPGGMSKVYNQNDIKVSAALGYDKKHALLYKDYYTRCTDCIQTKTEIWIPELPGGITPPFVNWVIFATKENRPADWPRPGLPPASENYDRPALRSGDVIIYAERISPADVPPITSAPDPLDCHTEQSFQPALIEAGGARGGRGGLGQPDSCLGDPINRRKYSGFSCISKPGGGLNAAGGRGGDAGNVYIHFLGYPTQANIEILTAGVNVRGGPGGSRLKLRLPRENLLGGSDVCAVKPEAKPRPAAPPGTPGEVEITDTTPATAWKMVSDLAQALDAIYLYDLRELASRARDDDRVASASFVGHLQSVAQVMVANADADLARVTREVITNTGAKEYPLTFHGRLHRPRFLRMFPRVCALRSLRPPFCRRLTA